MPISLLAAALALAATGAPVPAGAVGSCAWRSLPKAERDSFSAAWSTDLMAGGKFIRDHDAEMVDAARSCAGRPDLPSLWGESAVFSVAVQEASLAFFAPDAARINRSTLQQAWDDAPEAARQCTRAAAAKTLGINDRPCPDPHAPLALLKPFGVEPENLAAATQLLMYYNSKATGELAEGLISRFRSSPPTATK
jgi:hypothetical protein